MMYPSGEYKLLIDSLVVNSLAKDKEVYFARRRKPSLLRKVMFLIRSL